MLRILCHFVFKPQKLVAVQTLELQLSLYIVHSTHALLLFHSLSPLPPCQTCCNTAQHNLSFSLHLFLCHYDICFPPSPHSCSIRATSALCTGPHFHIPVSKPATDLITGSLFRYDVLSAAGRLWIILSHSTVFVVLSFADSCGLFSIMLRDCFNCFFSHLAL